MTKTATLLGVSTVIIANVMWAYTNQGKPALGKRNSGRKSVLDRKRSSYIEKDCFEKQQDYCSTGDKRAEYSS
jgi:hypothetical protein